jgi:hypothetical protein
MATAESAEDLLRAQLTLLQRVVAAQRAIITTRVRAPNRCCSLSLRSLTSSSSTQPGP